ncbi:MAG: hypothetical protein ACJA1Z_002790 [Patiriisocius sp.]|jgi:hypothetical protein|tara:strand:+ start:1383 stop:1997 length:615 start_codon:yes stop_codon:yes gene_type:complete
MFPFYPYETGVTLGKDYCVFDVPNIVRFGVSICYAMWFPETIRTLTTTGTEVIMHSTMSGTIDREIELSIVRAIASVNQCYFFDINGLNTRGRGRSIDYGPYGRILHQSEGPEEIIPLELNIERAKSSCELGILRLGQPLKSFRDHLKTSQFGINQPNIAMPYLDSLGPLIKPSRLDKVTELKIKKNSLEHVGSSIRYKGDGVI